ncbi:MAG TPA: DsbA family protein [Caulobacteraceae bacterium]|jgi:protein-disulfide isomerase|nr:DsbA family protein [Caulobacteraceae bacterium]
MRLFHLPLILAACAVALGGCDRSDKAFGARVHAYLMAHPEVIQEAVNELQKKDQVRAAAMAQATIGQSRAALEHDPRDFVANPTGRVTVTEFYDYRCPHCVNAAPAVVKLIHDDPDVRFVFKELPIFGAASDTAAAAAIAVKRAGGDYLGVYSDFMAARPLDADAIQRIMTAHGADLSRLRQPAFQKDASDQLLATRRLAATLGIEGTPAFIVGDQMIPGEDMDAVRAAINAARTQKG